MSKPIDGSKEEPKDSEFTWNVYDFPKHKKTEEIKLDWGEEKSVKSPAESGRDLIAEADRIFRFRSENEAFQEQLDAELSKMPLVNQAFEKDKPKDRQPEYAEYAPVTEADSEAGSRAQGIYISGNEPEFQTAPAAKAEAGGEPEPELSQAPQTEPEPETEAAGADPNAPLWFEQAPEPGGKKKGGCLKKAILIFVILFLASEVAALSIKYFWPDSAAAATVTRGQIAMVKTLDTVWEAISGLFDSADSDQQTGSDNAALDSDGVDQDGSSSSPEPADNIPDPVPDPTPAADKAALVSSMRSYNKNIETVQANEDLAYEAGRDYGVSDVNDSSPLEYNILETGKDGTFLYIDQEIVATLIAFDSQWVDYVNSGARDVIGLTKKDSRAYRNVSTYSKAGKVKQTFLLLEIGELRKGSNGYYAWTYEKIREKTGTKTAEKSYRWIYYLEPEDGSLKIVDYFRY